MGVLNASFFGILNAWFFLTLKMAILVISMLLLEVLNTTSVLKNLAFMKLTPVLVRGVK